MRHSPMFGSRPNGLSMPLSRMAGEVSGTSGDSLAGLSLHMMQRLEGGTETYEALKWLDNEAVSLNFDDDSALEKVRLVRQKLVQWNSESGLLVEAFFGSVVPVLSRIFLSVAALPREVQLRVNTKARQRVNCVMIQMFNILLQNNYAEKQVAQLAGDGTLIIYLFELVNSPTTCIPACQMLEALQKRRSLDLSNLQGLQQVLEKIDVRHFRFMNQLFFHAVSTEDGNRFAKENRSFLLGLPQLFAGMVVNLLHHAPEDKLSLMLRYNPSKIFQSLAEDAQYWKGNTELENVIDAGEDAMENDADADEDVLTVQNSLVSAERMTSDEVALGLLVLLLRDQPAQVLSAISNKLHQHQFNQALMRLFHKYFLYEFEETEPDNGTEEVLLEVLYLYISSSDMGYSLLTCRELKEMKENQQEGLAVDEPPMLLEGAGILTMLINEFEGLDFNSPVRLNALRVLKVFLSATNDLQCCQKFMLDKDILMHAMKPIMECQDVIDDNAIALTLDLVSQLLVLNDFGFQVFDATIEDLGGHEKLFGIMRRKVGEFQTLIKTFLVQSYFASWRSEMYENVYFGKTLQHIGNYETHLYFMKKLIKIVDEIGVNEENVSMVNTIILFFFTDNSQGQLCNCLASLSLENANSENNAQDHIASLKEILLALAKLELSNNRSPEDDLIFTGRLAEEREVIMAELLGESAVKYVC